MKRGILKKTMLGLVALLGLFLLRAATIVYPLQQLEPKPDPRLWRGAFHVHTSFSDGTGTPESVASAAKAAGAGWVVFAEHNKVDPDGTRYIDDVLAIASSEISTAHGHVVALGISRKLEEAERTGDPLGSMMQLGAEPVAAHPLNRRRPYTGLDEHLQLTGLEVLSADDLFREAMARPWENLVKALLAYSVNKVHGLSQLVIHPGPTLRKWDELLTSRKLSGFCSIDAHGMPDYEAEMRTVGFYALLDAPPKGDAATDAAAVKRALARGRSFCAIDAWGSAAGFRFVADAEGERVEMGSAVSLSKRPRLEASLEYASPPEGARMLLICGGKLVAETDAPKLSYEPTEPGACRVEVSIDARSAWGLRERKTWIMSNPIYVT